MAHETNSENLMPVAGRKSLPELARQFSKAIERGKGLRHSAADLNLMAAHGVNELLQAAAAQQLKEIALCRDARDQKACINEEASGSIGRKRETVHSAPLTSPSTV